MSESKYKYYHRKGNIHDRLRFETESGVWCKREKGQWVSVTLSALLIADELAEGRYVESVIEHLEAE